MRQDASVRELFDQMTSLLERMNSFVTKLNNTVHNIHVDEKRILSGVVRTSRECADYITTFCDSKFGLSHRRITDICIHLYDYIGPRAIKCTLFGEASQKIEGFKSKFNFLEKSFNEQVWDGTKLITHQILQASGQYSFSRHELFRTHFYVC